MKKILVVLTIVVLCACVAKVKVLSQADADRGTAKFPGVTLATLNEGKNVYEQNCASCHALAKPTSQTEEQWNKIVPNMVKKTNKKAGKEEVDSKEQELILQYVVTMCSAK